MRHSAPIDALVTRALRIRANDRQRGVRAAMAAALVPTTEAYAFAYTEDLASQAGNTQAQAAARRVAGMIATHKETRLAEAKGSTIGGAIRALHHKSHGYWPGDLDNGTPKQNAIIAEVNALPLLPMEQAAQTLALFVGRCGTAGVPVNFYDLAHTLTRWGNGISPVSVAVRRKVVSQFYTPTPPGVRDTGPTSPDSPAPGGGSGTPGTTPGTLV